jgi:hypothetical protein
MKNLLDFCDAVLENGGATFNLVMGTSPTNGYIVSEAGHEVVMPMMKNEVANQIFVTSAVRQYISDKGYELSLVDNYLGAWVDKNKLYLDISRVYDNEDEARAMAIKNNQIAYFDLNTLTSKNV